MKGKSYRSKKAMICEPNFIKNIEKYIYMCTQMHIYIYEGWWSAYILLF